MLAKVVSQFDIGRFKKSISVFLRLKDGAVLLGMPDALAVVAPHVIADAVVSDRPRVGEKRKVVDVHGFHHVPDII